MGNEQSQTPIPTDAESNESGAPVVVATGVEKSIYQTTPLAYATKEIDTELAASATADELDFAGNLMGSEGAKYLATKLKGCTKAISLDLRVNNIDDAGLTAIIAALPENVTELLLRNNDITDDGAKALAKFMETNAKIKILDLSDNEIGDEGAAALAAMLEKNTTLTDLDLFHNAIKHAGGKALAAALKKTNSLKDFDVSANDIDNEEEYAMESNFKEHLAIESKAAVADTKTSA